MCHDGRSAEMMAADRAKRLGSGNPSINILFIDAGTGLCDKYDVWVANKPLCLFCSQTFRK